MLDNTPGRRLTEIIHDNRMTKKEFALKLGYNPSYITQLCKGLKPPSLEFASKVERVFGVPVQWLLEGDSPENNSPSPAKDAVISKLSYISSEEELRAILAFINCLEELPKNGSGNEEAAEPEVLPEASKDEITTMTAINEVKGRPSPAAWEASVTRPISAKPAKTYTIPVKGIVAGGSPIYAYETYDETVESPIKADSALYIKGRSMEPDYPDGSLILVKENTYISNGDVVVALIMLEAEVAEATCKIFKRKKKKISLIPINPDYETQSYDFSSGYEIKIFGKVIGKID